MTTEAPLLIAFDGSDDAQKAIAVAGRLLGPRPAVVLTVWEPLIVSMSRHLAAMGAVTPLTVEDADEGSKHLAHDVAERGVELAREAGFEATALSRSDAHDIAETIVAVAGELDASLIVTGSRGLHGVRSLIGSVSEHVTEHAKRPVLVVPHGCAD